LIGSSSISQEAYVDELGQWYLEEHEKTFPGTATPSEVCFNYDAALLVAHTTNFLLDLGYDYESAEEMRKGFYKIRFTGCSGVINFSEGTNDRDVATFKLDNLQLIDDVYTVVELGIMSPLSATFYRPIEGVEPIFGDGTSDSPATSRFVDHD
jgi:hypothetical protein